MQTELYLKMISISLGLLIGLMLSGLIYVSTPKHWWSNKAKRIGLTVAICGVTLQLGLYAYNNLRDLSPTERIQLREVAAKSEAQACQAAGYSPNGFFWDSVHNHHSSHHVCEGYFASRLMCLGENHLVHEIFPPTCHSRNLKACK